MAQRDLLKRYLDAGMAFTAMTKSRAEGIVRELVRAGEIQRDQVQTQVDELIERSRRNSDHLVALVRKEVTSQLKDLGNTLRDELKAVERRVSSAAGSAGTVAGATKEAATKAAATKAAATKAAATKAPAKKASAKAPAKKASAKAPAKKARTADTGLARKAPGLDAESDASAGRLAGRPKQVPARSAAVKKASAEKASATVSGGDGATKAPAKRGATKKAAVNGSPAAAATAKKVGGNEGAANRTTGKETAEKAPAKRSPAKKAGAKQTAESFPTASATASANDQAPPSGPTPADSHIMPAAAAKADTTATGGDTGSHAS